MKIFGVLFPFFLATTSYAKLAVETTNQVASNDAACLAWLKQMGGGRLFVLSEYNTLNMYHKPSAAAHLRLICSHIFDPKIIGTNQDQRNFLKLSELAYAKNSETSTRAIENLIATYKDKNFDQADAALRSLLGSNEIASMKESLIRLSRETRPALIQSSEFRPRPTDSKPAAGAK